jgi:hypothetical protein
MKRPRRPQAKRLTKRVPLPAGAPEQPSRDGAPARGSASNTPQARRILAQAFRDDVAHVRHKHVVAEPRDQRFFPVLAVFYFLATAEEWAASGVTNTSR